MSSALEKRLAKLEERCKPDVTKMTREQLMAYLESRDFGEQTAAVFRLLVSRMNSPFPISHELAADRDYSFKMDGE